MYTEAGYDGLDGFYGQVLGGMAQHTRPYLHRAESTFCANRYVEHSQLILYCIIYKVFSICIVHVFFTFLIGAFFKGACMLDMLSC